MPNEHPASYRSVNYDLQVKSLMVTQPLPHYFDNNYEQTPAKELNFKTGRDTSDYLVLYSL